MVLVAALLATAIACTPAVAKPGKLVGKGTDNGFPIAYAKAFVRNPRTLKVRIKGTPKQEIEVLSTLTCRRGGKKARVREKDFLVTPTKTRKLKMGTKRPADCTVDVQAAYVDASITGFVKIELFAKIRR